MTAGRLPRQSRIVAFVFMQEAVFFVVCRFSIGIDAFEWQKDILKSLIPLWHHFQKKKNDVRGCFKSIF
jgi:hypothetical protein